MFVNNNKWTDDNSGVRGTSQKRQPGDGSQRQSDPNSKAYDSGDSHKGTNFSNQILRDNYFPEKHYFHSGVNQEV